ncbi:MAG TPA: response regulator transcription factor [Tepidisphaeraceae bacterium]|jgi:DNA-binding NarL/FixJ family response regulator|nr:response regulator transcription factor [Tepidisphaeraceae bacterium]
MTGRARVLLADDHPAVLEQLRTLLGHDFDVVACVRDGYGLLGAALVLRPDVVVSDVAMPGMDGIDAVARIHRECPTLPVVLVSVHGEMALVERGLRAGALGYVLKASAGEDLVPAVQAALRGEKHVSPQLIKL